MSITMPRNFLTLILVLSLAACSKVQVVPENNPPGTPPDIIPPISMPGGNAPVTGGGTHTVQPGEGLYGIARQYNLNFRDLAAWNNISSPYILQPGQVLNVTPGGASAGYPNPPAAPAPAASQYYTVQRGDTLYSISRRYGKNFRDVAAWNRISSPYSLSVGQQLIVNAGGGAIPSPSNQPAAPRIVEFDPYAPPYGAPAPSAPASGSQYYQVQRGDTLYSISRRYGQSVQQLASWNNLRAPYALSPGRNLVVGSGGSSAPVYTPQPTAPVAASGGVHIVQAGDTLYSLARRYGSSVQNLKAMNNLHSNSLSVGQRLNIPSGSNISSYSYSRPVAASPSPYSYSKAPMSAPSQPAQVATTKTFHTVQQGESLASIAALYGQRQQDLALWNGVPPPYILAPGQTLMVFQ